MHGNHGRAHKAFNSLVKRLVQRFLSLISSVLSDEGLMRSPNVPFSAEHGEETKENGKAFFTILLLLLYA